MTRLACVLLVAGCTTPLPDDYPVAPGGWAPGGNNARDGGPDDGGDGGATIAGRVCVVDDQRDLETCAVTGAGSLIVSLGGRTAVTEDDGRFTISTPGGSNLVWRVSGPGHITTVMPFGAVTKLPAVTVATYNEVMSASGVVLSIGQGSLVARVVQGGQPVVGATATVTPDAQYEPFYDGASAVEWDDDATGTYGLVWIPGAPVGTATVTVMRAGSSSATQNFLIEDQALTFQTIEIP